MVTSITELKLGKFQEFEDWLDEQQLFDSDVLYRGHAESTWRLESTLHRHQLKSFDARSPFIGFPISKYTDVAKKLQAIVETHTDRHFDDNREACDRFSSITEGLSFHYAVYVRHHGFPSPLLDWSLSPYVAAYFAFNDAANRTETKNGNRDDESRVAIYVMRPPKYPYKERVVFAELLSGDEAGIHYWPNPVKGEPRHYDQQSAYTTALLSRQFDGGEKIDCYNSQEYILENCPQDLAPGTNRYTNATMIDNTICWKVTIPRHDSDSVLTRLNRMNINAYTLLHTEDALVKTYGLRELHRMGDTT